MFSQTAEKLPSLPELAVSDGSAMDLWRRPSTAGGASVPSLAGSGPADRRSATSMGTRSKSATHLSSSLRSGTSSVQKKKDLQRMQILKAVRKEEESALAELEAKDVVRSSLADYFAFKSGQQTRAREKIMKMPAHLKPGTDPIDQGNPMRYETATAVALDLPVKMAVDPKWSTELKKVNNRVGDRLEYERKLSAACPGSIAPELPHMWPKKYRSNPPTPGHYFEPGKAGAWRAQET
eukprot:TRINITY_DN26238_c0_g1_i1.p1 TRINITY_DN26238_c0_g1~~TRINITY_DN26238_c0_g1_i1.p1  ORF type:complete len:237 (-),score=42.72 TRINITY_DN26238_c0_g1_i1:71-781(-)